MAVLPPGTLVGRYQIQALVGQGGMGIVYRALDPALDRRVALKLLVPHLLGNPDALARFRREAMAVANLKHPNIATVFELGEHDGQPFIAVEWIEGQTLTHLMAEKGPLPLPRALLLYDQLGSALDYAHANRVIHRDIKPSNIIVRANDHATIVDFGLAWADAGPSITATGSIFGTPQYMAPEQIEGKKVDGRADLYALACVLYEMLSGRPPFEDKSTPAILHHQLYEPPPPIRELNPALPLRLQNVLDRGLAKKPEDRFPNAKAFGAALHAAASASAARPRRLLAALALLTFLCVCISGAFTTALVARMVLSGAPPAFLVAGVPTFDPARSVMATVALLPTPFASPTSDAFPTPTRLPSPTITPAPTQPPTASLTATSTPTASPTPPPTLTATPTMTPTPAYYAIVNARSSLCLTVATNPERSGAAVVQDRCSGGDDQKWEILPVRERGSQMRLLSTGMCLDIDGGAAENDGIIQRTCDPARDTQLWQLKSYDMNYEIVGVHGGLCVEVPAFQMGRLIQMTYYGCNPNKMDNANQRWLTK